MTYADGSVLHVPMRVGKATGAPDLRITVAQDGGHIQATVNDKDGNQVPDCNVAIIPESRLFRN